MFVGLMKYLCELAGSADAQAEEILSNETREKNVSQTVTSSWGSNSILNDGRRDCKENILGENFRGKCSTQFSSYSVV